MKFPKGWFGIYDDSPKIIVQLLCRVWLFATQAPLSSPISQSLLRFMCIESVMLSNHLILCCSLLLLTSIFPNIGVFVFKYVTVVKDMNEIPNIEPALY